MSSLRIEREPVVGMRQRLGKATRPSQVEYQWVIYEGAVAVLRCDAEADARTLLAKLRARREAAA